MTQLWLFNEKLIIDPEDRARVLGHRWYLHKYQVKGRVNGKAFSLARFVLNYTGPRIVDHINRNPWDNRKENLRLVSTKQSLMNRGPRSSSKHSQYKGVTKKKGKWVACLTMDGKRYSKYARSEVHAAELYNDLAIKHHGEFAYLNEIK